MSRATRALGAAKVTAAAAAIAIAPFLMGCSLGQGDGEVHSDQLYAKECWCNAYNLQPDFFAAVPYRDTLQIRVQRGTDLQEVSDGLAVLVDDVKQIREEFYGKELKVALPVGVQPPGSLPPGTSYGDTPDAGAPNDDAGAPNDDAGAPDDDAGTGEGGEASEGCGPKGAPGEVGTCDLAPLEAGDPVEGPAIVHMALYLQQTCHNQNVVLYAVSGSIIFETLFSGDPNESDATKKLTKAIFDVQMGDLQEVPPGAPADSVPADKLTRLRGCFRFYFERGQPGQPFP
jgi:hypothetical protein